MTTRSSLKVLRPLAVGALALALATPAVAMPLDPGTPTQQQVDAAKAATGAAAASVAAIESAYAAANVRLADLDKAAAVAEALTGSSDTPAGIVRGRKATKWFIDRDAGHDLPWFECTW